MDLLGSYQCSSTPLAGFKGPTAKRREGEERERRVGKGEGRRERAEER